MPPKLIAFHLPQFHPIPENDAWWGKGFTEWTNVTRATPRFPGHHQPQLPTDLGFYDLRLPEARAAQAALAREYGIHGFCYYHYWFNGKRLLERPVEEILASGQPDFPFCLCWANENWTRRWDGAEREVLIGQNYNDDDDLAHIRYLIEVFRDPRYIRVDGKPLILIYRARHLPDPRRTTGIWRKEARRAGIGELFICRVENFFNERDDPHALGFDASVDFQPDWKAVDDDTGSVVLPDDHFVIDYREMVDAQFDRPPVPHLRFPGVTPSWDNSARRKKNAFIIADSTPEAYEHWLTETLHSVSEREDEHQLVFINAWNEWAEGNHLEPDQKFGRAYLEATRRALQAAASPPALKPPPLLDPLSLHGFVPREAYLKRLDGQGMSKAVARLHEAHLATVTPTHFRIILDATRCDDAALQRTLSSVAAQLHEHWQLEVLSPQPSPNIASSRLTWHTIAPAQASAAIAELVQGCGDDWHVALQGGEQIAQDALLFAAQALIDAPSACLLLSDGDTRDDAGQPVQVWLAPGVNPDWLRSTLKIGGLVIARTAIILSALADIGDSPSKALSLAAVLRACEHEGARTIVHLARLGLSRPDAEPPIPLGFRAELLQLHLQRQGLAASIEHGMLDDSCRLRYTTAQAAPAIAVIFADPGDRDLTLRSVEAILAHAGALALSLLLPLTPATPPALRQCLLELDAIGSPSIRIVELADTSVAETANRLAEAAAAELLLFLDSGLVPLDAEALTALAAHALRPGIGACGGRVVASDGTLVHGMLRLGQMGVSATALQGVSANYAGNGGELLIEQDCSAVSMHYLLMRRETFLAANGFRAERYPQRHADIDLCLRLAQTGLRTLWSPFATMVAPTASPPPRLRPPAVEDATLLEDWLTSVPVDPYFNRQFTRHLNRPRLQTDMALAQDSLPWHPVPRVYVHPADTAGCGEIRVSAPLRALARASLIQPGGGTRFLSPWELAMLAPDTVVTQRVFSDRGLDWLASYRKYGRSLLIYELDDLITRIPRENDNARGFPADIEARLTRALGLCDRLVVSTEPLAQAYGRHAAETVIVPNLLDDALWARLTPARVEGAKPRIGWAGSNSHGGDLALIQDVVRTLADEVDWVFLGYCPESLRPHVREFHPAVAVKDYPAALAALGLDIAVAPLAANAFNEAKSNLKLLEYGALGYPVVCSNVLPYQGELAVVRVANTARHWLSALRELIADRDGRDALGHRLQSQVRAHWMIDGHADAWLKAWTR